MEPLQLPPDAATDPEAALPWVRAEIQRVATAKGWSSAGLSAALQSADVAFQESDEAAWWGMDPATFWAALDRETAAGSWAAEPGAADLRRLWATAAGWTVAVQQQEEQQSLGTQIGGTVTATAEDAAAAAAAAKAAGKSPVSWGLAAIIAAVVVVVVIKR